MLYIYYLYGFYRYLSQLLSFLCIISLVQSAIKLLMVNLMIIQQTKVITSFVVVNEKSPLFSFSRAFQRFIKVFEYFLMFLVNEFQAHVFRSKTGFNCHIGMSNLFRIQPFTRLVGHCLNFRPFYKGLNFSQGFKCLKT